MPMLKTITLNELIKQLQELEQDFGDERVLICNPDDSGFDYLPISDVHFANGCINIQVPIKKETEWLN